MDAFAIKREKSIQAGLLAYKLFSVTSLERAERKSK
jgi:hypothetical protein